MFDDTTDVIQGGFGKTCILITSKQRFATLPDRLMAVHARTVIANHRFGHKGGGQAILMGNHLDNIFVFDHRISHVQQGAKFDAQFMLGNRHLMVMLFDFHAHIGQG